MGDKDPSMRIEVPSMYDLGNRLTFDADRSPSPLPAADEPDAVQIEASQVSEHLIGREEVGGITTNDDGSATIEVPDDSVKVSILSMETGNVTVSVTAGSDEGGNLEGEDASEDWSGESSYHQHPVVDDGEVETMEAEEDSAATNLGGLVSGEVIALQIDPEEERQRLELEEAAREQEIKRARVDCLFDIDSNLRSIYEEVERQLRTLHVFDKQDLTLGVAGLVASLVVDRARGYTETGDNPLAYVNARMQDGQSLTEYVADNNPDNNAGTNYLKTLLQHGFLSEGVGREIGRVLTERYNHNHRVLSKFKRIESESLFEGLTSEQSWGIIKQAFVTRARDCSLKSHNDFFSNIRVVEGNKGSHIEHDMPSDFLGLTKVCRFEWGVDCQTVNRGSGEAAYVLVPINEPSPLSEPEIEDLRRAGKQERIKLSVDKSHYIERDSIDALVELAGGTNGSIANIGGYERSSFMAIINASGNPAMTSAEFSGGYLIACYDPSTPIYKVASNEDAPAPVLYDEYNYYFPSTDSATKGTGHIKWATRTWQLTDKGHSLVQTAIQNAKNNSEALITPFLDPRPLIRESYVEVAHKAVQRAIAKRVLQERRLVQIAAFDNAASDIDAGVNPQDIAAVSMPQLDESGLRSTWLPPSPALRAIDTPNGGNVSELAGLVANSGEVHGVFTGEDTQETEVSSDDSVSFY